MDEEKIEEIRQRYSLSYHISYLLEGEKHVGFKGLRVLEVGGSLPKELVIDQLKCESWIALEDITYWQELPIDGGGTRPSISELRRISDIKTMGMMEKEYEVILGNIDDFPKMIEGYFDRIFSIACFEHIHTLGFSLEKMHRVLKPGGILFSMFSPIWSAHDGHHLPNITDGKGIVFDFHKSPVPPWGHLLMSPSEMFLFLKQRTDLETAKKIVYYVYHSPHINRLFTEDYVNYFNNSPFKINKLIPTFQVQIPANVNDLLRKLYPKNIHFENNGILVVLKKEIP